MRTLRHYLALLPLAAAPALHAGLAVPVGSLTVSNPSDFPRPDALVTCPIAGLGILPTEDRAGWLIVRNDGLALPSQILDSDADGQPDTLAALYSFAPGETAELVVEANQRLANAAGFPRRAQADLAIKTGGRWEGRKYVGGTFQNVPELVKPPQHTDHSFYIRYEGPGLESDKVGYRFYLDWRNGYDIFGKRSGDMVLQRVGLDGFESYHHDAPWGMDILKVGDALGIGAPGFWDGHQVIRVSDTRGMQTRIVENGPIVASLNTRYTGWRAGEQPRVDLDTVLSMQAGSRLVHVQAKVEGTLPNLCTGLIKLPDTELLRSSTDRTGAAWAYLATWGRQSLNDDMLGMAIFFRIKDLRQVTEDAHNHVVVLRGNNNFEYYFAAAWEGEAGGITTRDAFQAWLDQTVEEIERPLRSFARSGAGEIAKAGPLTAESALRWSEWMAESEMERYGLRLAHPEGTWHYTTGLLTEAVHRLGEVSGKGGFTHWGESVIASFITPEGAIHSYRKDEFNIDQVNSGKMLLRLAATAEDARYRKAAALIYQQLQDHPKTSQGAFWHKKVYPWQVWLDGVYMGGPFYIRYITEHADDAELDAAMHEFLIVEEHLKDPRTGLYYHAWDEKRQQRWADKETGLSPEFWGRGIGWFAMALVDALDYLPEGHPGRADLTRILQDLAEALVKVQDEETGVWWQIVDKPGKTGNYRESSATAMYVYALAKGVRLGYLDASRFEGPALKGFKGMVDTFVRVDAPGTITLTNGCSVAGYGRMDSYEYYMTEQVIDNDPKATGPFILAGIEVSALLNRQ